MTEQEQSSKVSVDREALDVVCKAAAQRAGELRILARGYRTNAPAERAAGNDELATDWEDRADDYEVIAKQIDDSVAKCDKAISS